MQSWSLIIVATVEQLKSNTWPMCVGVSPFAEFFTMLKFTSMVMAFLFVKALPSEESALRLGVIIKGKKYTPATSSHASIVLFTNQTPYVETRFSK